MKKLKTKKLSLANQIEEILRHYYLDSYNRNVYYKKCTEKIIELLKWRKENNENSII